MSPPVPRRVLLVGAGAVGAVYGRHLQKAGDTVAFYVKEKYRAETAAGFTMYALSESKAPVRFEGFEVLCSLDEVAARPWDEVWLCVSSPALRGGWLGPLVEAAKGARVVSFQPGLRDGELLLEAVPAERLVKGIIAFSSWHAPLPGEVLDPPGTAYWFPPLSPCLFQGPGAQEVARRLSKGGCPSRVGDADAMTARGSAFLNTAVAALECAGWTFAALREGPWSGLAADAGSEALDIATAHLGIGRGPMGALTQGFIVRAATRAVPLVAPFDFEAFLKLHFTKVGDQTLQALDTWIAEGQRQGKAVGRLQELRAALVQARARQAS